MSSQPPEYEAVQAERKGAPVPVNDENEHARAAELSEEDRINQMTLGTAPATKPGPDNSNVVTQQPPRTQGMRPENYVVKPEFLGEMPEFVDCPYCKTRQKTRVRHESTSQTALAAAVCCLCCGILPGLIPFCCQWCSDVDHYCEGCNKRVAHQPYEGKMEAVLPQPPAARPGQDPRYQASAFANMTKQEQHEIGPVNGAPVNGASATPSAPPKAA